MLLSGDTYEFDDSNCSYYASAKRKIPEKCITFIQKPANRNEILRRIKYLAIHSTDCLSLFWKLVDSGDIAFNDIRVDTSIRTPKTDDELQLLLTQLFICSTECARDKIIKLTSEQIAMLKGENTNTGKEKTNHHSKDKSTNSSGKDFSDNFSKPLFWSDSSENTLENLYLSNTYFIKEDKPHDDLDELVNQFIAGTLNDYLKKKKGIMQYVPIHTLFITAPPGCGKTSLISKIAHDKVQDKHIYFINMADMRHAEINLKAICEKLSINKKDLIKSILILDSLDEALQHSENCDEVLSELSDEFGDYEIRAIITCRSNLLTSNEVRSSFEIKLQGFDTHQAVLWLENYAKYNPDFPLDDWKYTATHMNSSLSQVLLIPLILYICVIRKIPITKVNSIGTLYDILFDPKDGQVALPIYRSNANYRSSEWSLLRNVISDISVIMHQKGFVDESDITEENKRLLGRDLYMDSSSGQLRFIHASMWQYFVAERIYKHLKDLRTKDDIQAFLDGMLDIVVPQNTLDNLILGFISYFANRDNWKPARASLYKDILFHISEYNITKKGNILTIISCLWRDLFKIFTHIFVQYYPDMLNTFFTESVAEQTNDILIKCSILTEESPIQNVSKYRMKKITLNGINFTKSYMRYCSMRSSSFRNANFNDASLVGIYADHCDMTASSFRQTSLHNANLTDSILVACDFRNAKLNGANFDYSNLSYADLREAKLQKTFFNNAVLTCCKISVQHLDTFNLELIAANKMEVYDDNNNLMTSKQIYDYYYSKHPVEMAFKQYASRMRNQDN